MPKAKPQTPTRPETPPPDPGRAVRFAEGGRVRILSTRDAASEVEGKRARYATAAEAGVAGLRATPAQLGR